MGSGVAGNGLAALGEQVGVEFEIVLGPVEDGEVVLGLANEGAGVGVVLDGDLYFAGLLHFGLEDLLLDDFGFFHFAGFEVREVQVDFFPLPGRQLLLDAVLPASVELFFQLLILDQLLQVHIYIRQAILQFITQQQRVVFVARYIIRGSLPEHESVEQADLQHIL